MKYKNEEEKTVSVIKTNIVECKYIKNKIHNIKTNLLLKTSFGRHSIRHYC